MTEKHNQLTKSDLMDTLAQFNEDVLLPQMREVLDEEFKTLIKPEINKAKQETMDWTDKRISEAENRIVHKIVPRIDTLTEVLHNKKVISRIDVARIAEAGRQERVAG